jgi:hypothetical protein
MPAGASMTPAFETNIIMRLYASRVFALLPVDCKNRANIKGPSKMINGFA